MYNPDNTYLEGLECCFVKECPARVQPVCTLPIFLKTNISAQSVVLLKIHLHAESTGMIRVSGSQLL